MTVLPVPSIPEYTQRSTGITPPAGLVILAKPHRVLPPASSEGSGLPADKIMPNSGIYDSNGKLPQTPGPGMTFIVRV
jgi:hypothetical protein